MTESTAVAPSLVIERNFPHPPQKLWRALTESPLIAQWLMANDFAPAVGHKFQFRREPVAGWNGIIDCEVLVVEAGSRLAYTWETMGQQFKIDFTLAPSADGTSLRMEQSGFQPDQHQAYNGAKYGWQGFLGALDRITGEISA